MAFSDSAWCLVAVLGSLTLARPEGLNNTVRLFYLDPWPKETTMKNAVTLPGRACPINVCENGGTCHMSNGKHQCLCRPGFIGHNCQDMRLDLSCHHDGMKLQILKNILVELSVNTSVLHLSNPQCKVNDTSDLYVSVTLTHVNHTHCGTLVKVNGTHLIYSNELTTSTISEKVDIPGDSISRSSDIRIRFSCVYHYDRVVSLPFPLLTSASLVTFMVKEGEFNVSMTLHPTEKFLEPYERPPIIPLAHRLYVQLQIHGHGPQDYFTLKLEECWATPGANHSSKIRHLLISNGQGNDSTVAIIKSANQSLSRFSLQMFHFVKYPEFYLHCRIWLCQPNTTHCCERPKPSIGRQKRDLNDPYRKVVSCGPIRLATVSSVENPESGLSPLILPGSFAAGAILLLFSMVAIAKAMKKAATLKRPRAFCTLPPTP